MRIYLSQVVWHNYSYKYSLQFGTKLTPKYFWLYMTHKIAKIIKIEGRKTAADLIPSHIIATRFLGVKLHFALSDQLRQIT